MEVFYETHRNRILKRKLEVLRKFYSSSNFLHRETNTSVIQKKTRMLYNLMLDFDW